MEATKELSPLSQIKRKNFENKALIDLKNILKYQHSDNLSLSYSRLNDASFKNMLSYFNKLKMEGFLNEKAYSELVLQICSTYIENEVSTRVSEVMEKFFTNKFLG